MNKPAIEGGKPVREKKIYYGHQCLDDSDYEAVLEVLKSDYLTCGPKINELEDRLCKLTGAKYAVVCSNGTAALHIAAMAAGLKEGDELITTPITFAASANCVRYCGGTPVFADIRQDTYNIDVEDVKSDILKLVVNYLNYYSNNDTPKIPDVVTSNDLKKQVSAWDYKFVNGLSFEQTFNLINAGLLLELDHLHDLGCAKIAAFMKGKTPEEVNKEFTIECQLTQEEAKELGLESNENN